MDKVRIQDDLYEHVNGEWLATAVIPDDQARTGGFSSLADGVEKLLMADFDAFSKGTKTTDVETMDDAIRLFNKVKDEQKRQKDGISPLMPLLKKIEDLHCVNCLNRESKSLLLEGVDLPIEMYVRADMKDAKHHAFMIQGPSMILPDTTYYQEGNVRGEQLLAVYKDMASKLLAFTDLSKEDQELYLADTFAYDKLISQKVKSQLEWADYTKSYNPMALEEVCEMVAPFDLKKLLVSLYGEDNIPSKIIVADPRAIKEMKDYYNAANFNLYKHWAYVKTLVGMSSLLSVEMASIASMYRRAMMGIAVDPTLDKQAYQIVSRVFYEPVGIYYGRTYFGEEAKKDITSLVDKIIETWKVRVARNTFLQEATKQKAILKLSTIVTKLGYPDEVRDIFKQFKVTEEESYFDSMHKISMIRTQASFDKLLKEVVKSEWLMPAHMVNACYDESRNDITFPAAILQKPFYSIEQSLSENLGGIGAVISHEISHAFDNNGAHFDENGNLENWWTDQDFENFQKLTKDMIEQWDGIPFAGLTVNGELVVSENIADNGGIAVTIEMMHNMDNTDFELYFKNWAKVWCMKARDAYMQYLLINDVHSPAKLRANIAVRNFKEWYETFNVVETDEMYIPEDKRIIIW